MKKRLILIAVVLVALTVVLTAFAQTQTGERPQRGRGGFQNMTEEQRTQMRERYRNMSEEERAQFRQRLRAGRRSRMSREDQLKCIAELELQLAKLKASVEAQPQGRTNYRDLSEEERTKLREQYAKAREVRQAVITAIRAEVDKLSPPRATTEQIAALRELREIRTLAEKEKAAETTKRLAALIEKQTQQMPARGRGGAGGGGQRRGTGQDGQTQ